MEPDPNPYAAPQAIDPRPARSSLPPLWRRALTSYLRQHAEGATFGGLLRASWKHFLFGALYFGASGVWMVTAGFPSAGWFWLGLWAGSVLFMLGQFRGYPKLWPLIDQITDWDRVRRLLDDRDDAGRPDA